MEIMFKGMIMGMEDMGAKFISCDGINIFFNISKGSEIDDKEKLIRVRDSWKEIYGLTLKIKKI